MRYASITVTFNPDPALIMSKLWALPDNWVRLVVDNGTSDDGWRLIEQAVVCLPEIEVLRLGANQGLAAAQNRGLYYLAARGDCTHVLLLDQDSEPLQGSASALADAYSDLMGGGYPLGAIGPTLRDTRIRCAAWLSSNCRLALGAC